MKTNVTGGALDQPLDHQCLLSSHVYLQLYLQLSLLYLLYLLTVSLQLCIFSHFLSFYIYFSSFFFSNIIIYVYIQYHHFVFSLVSNITFSGEPSNGENSILRALYCWMDVQFWQNAEYMWTRRKKIKK